MRAPIPSTTGQSEASQWTGFRDILEILGNSWIILNCSKFSQFSLFILFSPEAHIRYQCWVGKSSEGPRELEARGISPVAE